MKKTNLVYLFLLINCIVFSQEKGVKYNVGHTFNIVLPNYFSKTGGINSDASIQYKNDEKDVYGIVIVDTKEELGYADIQIASATEFYEDFITEFLEEEQNRKLSKPLKKTLNGIQFVEADISYYDTDAETDIYYSVGIVETKKAYYKVLSWCTVENKEKFKKDFQSILYSITD